jgi:hypothetical protein
MKAWFERDIKTGELYLHVNEPVEMKGDVWLDAGGDAGEIFSERYTREELSEFGPVLNDLKKGQVAEVEIKIKDVWEWR